MNINDKKLKFGENKCPGQIEYIRLSNEFFLISNHNNICNSTNISTYDNNLEINEAISDYKNLKNNLIQFLNRHPLIALKIFKILVIRYVERNPINYELKPNTLSDIYYPWKYNSKIFSFYSIFFNDKTSNNKSYLKDVSFSLIYNEEGNKL